MAEFLTTTSISHKIEKILKNAQKFVVLVSPYYKISPNFIDRIKDVSNRNVSIKIIYGKEDLSKDEYNALTKIKNLELYYFHNLHAKCYCNENEIVISSMNLYEYSEKNNREMGAYFQKEYNKDFFKDALDEIKSIITNSSQPQIKQIEKKPFKKEVKKLERGFCIRCAKTIPLNSEKPYCKHCFETWEQYGNAEYQEAYCHVCGEDHSSTLLKPMCYGCFVDNKNMNYKGISYGRR